MAAKIPLDKVMRFICCEAEEDIEPIHVARVEMDRMTPASRRSGPSAITCVSNGLTGGTGSGFIDGELGMW